MYVGIDVGGTFTDGVIVRDREVIAAVKVPTYPELTRSITEVLSQIMSGKDSREIKGLVLSTTIVTNLIAQKNLPRVGLILMPGPGLMPERLKFAAPAVVVDGAVDYRGRILQDLQPKQLKQAVDDFLRQGISKIAVACKFSQRNNKLEKEAVEYLMARYPQVEFLASWEVSGLLNWVRRANGAVYTLATRSPYSAFVGEVEKTLARLGLSCPVQVLKADAGTMPLQTSLQYPLEAIFSGPAASALGAMATAEENLTAVVLDIGGTTTDLALVLKGVPLLAERGTFLEGYPIPTRALAVSSVALGGDSTVEMMDGKVRFGPRKGPALCLGGPSLTVTDLLAYQGLCDLPVGENTRQAVAEAAKKGGQSPADFINLVITEFIAVLEKELAQMFLAWEEEPAYRIWQVLNPRHTRPDLLICQGGPAAALGSLWAQKKGWRVKVSSFAHVANAVGAALARNTLKLEYTADTERLLYTTNLGGYQGKLTQRLNSLAEARQTALELYDQIAGEWKIEVEQEPELLYEEIFNLVRGWSTTGKIIQIGLQTPPGLRTRLREEEIRND